MLSCESNSGQLGYIRYVFLYFELVSRLKVNQSELVSIDEVKGIIELA